MAEKEYPNIAMDDITNGTRRIFNTEAANLRAAFIKGYSLRSSQQVSAVALLEKFVNACYTGCSKDELDLLRQEGEDILKIHNK